MLTLKPLVLVLIACCVTKELTAASSPESGCILTSTECTCAEQSWTGPCSNPTASTGMCSGGDCNTSYKCDCLGYEKCTIGKCGRWKPADSAVISHTSNFHCTYEPSSSICRTPIGLMEVPIAADNAEHAAIAYTYQSGEEEAMIGRIFADVTKLKDQSFEALNYVVQLGDVASAESIEMTMKVDDIVNELALVAEEFADALQQASIIYQAIGKVRTSRNLSRSVQDEVDAGNLKLNDAQSAADKTGVTCSTCAALASEIDALMKERLGHTKDTVKWAASGRDAGRAMKEKRISIQSRHEEVKKDAASVSTMSQNVRRRVGKLQ